MPSGPLLASSLPSGLNASVSTPVWALAWMGAPTGWPVAGFHNRTVPSAPALASSVPVAEMNYASRRIIELQLELPDDRPRH